VDEPGLDLFLEPVGVALDVDRRRVVKDPVQDGRGDHRIAEDLVPLAEAAVRGQDQGPLLVTPRDELEKQMGAVAVDGDVADLVDDQELGLAVELEPLLDAVLGIGPSQGSNERHGLGEAGPVALGDGLDPQGDGQVGLSHPGRSQQDDVLPVGDVAAGCQLFDLLLVDGGLEGGVEALQGLDEGEAGHGSPHGDVLFGFGGHLLGQKVIEEVAVGEAAFGGLLKAGLQQASDPVQPQVPEVLLHAFDLGAHRAPPSTRRS